MARIGSITCAVPGCGNPDASVSETGAGSLALTCHRCEFSGYAKPGTKAARLVRSAMRPDEDAPAPAPSPRPAPTPPAPAPKAPSKLLIG